jgi:hypothetical protein
MPKHNYLLVLLTDQIVGQHVSAILGNLQAKIEYYILAYIQHNGDVSLEKKKLQAIS